MLTPGRLSLRSHALAGAFFFLTTFALYCSTHCASLYLDDSGETVTVAALLGIGHPPGYPLHSLLAHLATALPLGSPLEGVNLLAGLCAAAASAGLFIALLAVLATPGRPGLGPGLLAAALPAALLSLGPVYWHNALGAKGSIYQLNNLLSVGLLALLAWPGPLSPRRLEAFWLGLGLALAHHYMSQLPLLPAYAWLAYRAEGKLGPKFKRAWLLLPGLLLYLYIPLRSGQQPGLNWGAVKGWDGFWFFFLRMQYAGGEISRGAGTSAAQAWHALKLLGSEGSYLLPLLALVGLWQGRRESLAQALGLGWLAAVASVSLYLNLKPERFDLMKPYLFPAYLCQAWLAGLGLAACLARAWAWAWRAATATALVLLLGLVWARLPALDLSRYHYAEDNARNLLGELPRNALLLAQGDAVIFPLWYLQRVRQVRTDVAVIGLAVLPMDWVRDDLARRYPDLRHPRVLAPIGAESVPLLTRAYLELNPQRPRYAAFNQWDASAQAELAAWRLQGEGLVYRVVPAQGSPKQDRTLARLRLDATVRRGLTQRPLDERTLTLIVGDLAVHYNSLGVAAEEDHQAAEALALYHEAAKRHPEDPDFPFNMGNALYALGRKGEAAQAFERSVAVEPGYVNGWYNLAVTKIDLGDAPGARQCLQKAIDLAPERPDLRRSLEQIGG